MLFGFVGVFGGFLWLFLKWFAVRYVAAVISMLLSWFVGEVEVNDVLEDVVLDVSDDVLMSVFVVMIGVLKVWVGYK